MNKRDLEKLRKAELIKMVKKLQKKAKKPKTVIVDDDYRPVPPPGTYKPIPAPSANETIQKPVPKPRKSVKQMVNEYKDLILAPPPQFRDGYKPVPAPRTNETIKKPVPIYTYLHFAIQLFFNLISEGLVRENHSFPCYLLCCKTKRESRQHRTMSCVCPRPCWPNMVREKTFSAFFVPLCCALLHSAYGEISCFRKNKL